jgi:hypothetical protein
MSPMPMSGTESGGGEGWDDGGNALNDDGERSRHLQSEDVVEEGERGRDLLLEGGM